MSATQLHPDFGEPSYIATDGGDDYAINFAGVMELARMAGTERARTFRRAAYAEWRRLDGLVLAKGQREQRAMQAGIAEATRVHGPAVPVGEDC